MEFNKRYNRTEFVDFLQHKFLPEDFLVETTSIDIKRETKYICAITKLGSSETLDLVVYEVRHNSTQDARVGLSKAAFRFLADEWESRALVLFVPENNDTNYRFSLITIDLNETEEGRLQRIYSNPRRYSYYLGEGIAYYTPNKYLNNLGRVTSEKDLTERFSVEVLTKAFYQELSDWYAWAVKIIRFPNKLDDKNDDDKYNAEAAIRLVTRLIFVWFLKQKQLIPEEFFDEDYIRENLIEDFNPNTKVDLFYKSYESKYYKAILQNLFFAMLNSPITKEGDSELSERHFRSGRGDYDNNKLMRYETMFKNPQLFIDLANRTVPFLNGGLFDCLDDKDNKNYVDGFSDREEVKKSLVVPDYLFFGEEVGKNIDLSEWYGDKKKKRVSARGIINILKRYNFTVEENTPFDQEVSLDPELLGKVFENLLASYNPETQSTARKQTGSFYTPRDIVQYMVDESLVAHLKRMVGEELEAEYRKLISYVDEEDLLTSAQKQQVMEAIYHCKILDPACGSGAFPVGMLQQMVHILFKLDPTNEQWKKMMLDKAVTESRTAFQVESREEREERLKDIENSFDENLNNPDYARKLYLIENCIYGVDIQPIAIQISKLRFFISLVVDQKTTTDPANNFGIRPLPNLEAKFVAANSLIPLAKAENNLGRTPEIIAVENELKEANHKIFGAKTVRTKRKWKERLIELRAEIAEKLADNGFLTTDAANQLASWDMFNQNMSASFFDAEWMFGIKDGFDIVIGNPPYGAKLSDTDKKLLRRLYVNQTSETAILFIEKGHNELHCNGVLSYIIPKAFTYSSNYKSVRNYVKKDIAIIVDCGKAFEQVKLEACIISLRGNNNLETYSNLLYAYGVFTEIGNIPKSTCDDFGLYLNGVTPESVSIATKMQMDVLFLGDISSNCRGEALQSYITNDGEIDIIGGKNIDRYGIRSIKGKLNTSIPILGNARIQNNSLLYQNIVAHVTTPYPQIKLIGCIPDRLDCYIIDTINQITIDVKYSNKYIWALLNSKLICWYAYLFIYGKAIRTMHFDSVSTNRIPIKISKNLSSFIEMVDSMLNYKGKLNIDNISQEKLIDKMVYQLYTLTYDEVLIVDPETPITREEYEKGE